jgi:hypothetical protein
LQWIAVDLILHLIDRHEQAMVCSPSESDTLYHFRIVCCRLTSTSGA